MTRVDDLDVGQFVAVSDYYGEASYDSWSGVRMGTVANFDGKPWKITAISLPFVCLTDGRRRISLDIRLWGLQKVTPTYARAYEAEESRPAASEKSVFGKTRKKKEKPDPRACPRCRASRMVEKLKVPGQSVWKRWCKACGYEDDGPQGQANNRPRSPTGGNQR